MRFICISILILFFSFKLNAQTKPLQGFVVDKDDKHRLAKVYIYNSTDDSGLYNNAKGEFKTFAKVGDTIFAALQGYLIDTIVYKGQSTVIFQLKSTSIRLKQVEIIGKKPTPQEQYAKTIKEYKYALDRGSTKDLLNLGAGGVGLGIDAIYNLLSRSGKNARHLQTILERDYKESIIDFRFNSDYVKTLLGIQNPELDDFMLQYRPTYSFVLSASDYDFVLFVRNSYNTYKRNPGALRLPKLPKLEVVN